MTINQLYEYLFTNESKDKYKKLIFFGASKLGQQNIDFLRQTNAKKKVDYICDNNIKLHGKFINGIEIIGPQKLKNIDKKLVIITSMYVEQIGKQLKEMGIEYI